MKNIFVTTALGSAIFCGALLGASLAPAQDSNAPEKCVGENCPVQGGEQMAPDKKKMKGTANEMETGEQTGSVKKKIKGTANEADDQGDQTVPRKKRAQGTQQGNDVDVNVQGSQSRVRHGDWKFDSSRHQRRRSKDVTFRFYFGGYWYPQPYWDVYTVQSGRVSCRQGRAIVASRFNRVRVVECNGRTYTYLGRRQGDTYRIMLNARTGRIIGRALI